jgi:Fe-S cluster biogenesis protein NfuA
VAAGQDLRAVGDRIEALLAELDATADPRTRAQAHELLGLVTDLYGGALARIAELAAEHAPELGTRLTDDELVASLLVVHGLHPQSLEARVEGALATVRPMLATHGGDVELLGADGATGVVGLQLLGSCHGCPSSAVTLQLAVERAILEAAPEVIRIEVVTPADSGSELTAAGPVPVPAGVAVPVALRPKPPDRQPPRPRWDDCPAELAAT